MLNIRSWVCPLVLTASSMAWADIQPSDVGFELVPVATSLVSPIYATHANDGTGRLFIVDQAGKIWIHRDGAVLPTPFLDLTSVLPALNPGFDERGLLGLAFHPNYAQNGRFWVRFSRPRSGSAGEPCFGTARGCHFEVLAEFRVSAGNPDVADPTFVTEVFIIAKPQFNHNAGQVAFGPDGMLYVSMGDGGGANDGLADNPPSHGPIGNAQNLMSMMGKFMRFDVNGSFPFSIPADNPFVNTPNALPEIWAYGLRNPYRWSFDDGPGGDGRLWHADVGQNLTEEIDIITRGGNYGWVIKEGTHCFNPLAPSVYQPDSFCADRSAGLIDPIAQYERREGGQIVGISITGGFVYRGDGVAALRGKYVFGDYSTAFGTPDGHFFHMDAANPGQILRLRLGRTNRAFPEFLKGFGRDQDGELYVCSSPIGAPRGTSGTVYRVVSAPCQADLDNGTGGGTPDGGVTIDDLLYYVDVFGNGTTAADLDDGSGTGRPDGGVTIDDLLYFLGHFANGC